jgi:hypothetical protein
MTFSMKSFANASIPVWCKGTCWPSSEPRFRHKLPSTVWNASVRCCEWKQTTPRIGRHRRTTSAHPMMTILPLLLARRGMLTFTRNAFPTPLIAPKPIRMRVCTEKERERKPALAILGHVVADVPSRVILAVEATLATGDAETKAASRLLHQAQSLLPSSPQRRQLAADKNDAEKNFLL